MHRAAAEARLCDAELRVVLAWQSPGGELGSPGGLGPSVRAQCRAAAVERRREALDTAFGAAGPGIPLAGLTVRGTPGAVPVDYGDSAASSPETRAVPSPASTSAAGSSTGYPPPSA
ncbi:hypothetical protein ACFW9N_21415 [Streptomyces sp. NPDC059496]|uniref:hypothetical protein n=1 Tax=unclassified Streptomyces TaxID=2593676 RepID=UPI00365EEA46